MGDTRFGDTQGGDTAAASLRLGLDVGGSKAAFVLVHPGGEIAAESRIENWTTGDPERDVAVLLSAARALVDSRGGRVCGGGVSSPGPLDVPRGLVLEAACSRLGGSPRTALARHVEARAEALLTARHPERPLRANVEFFTAVLLEAVGIPRAMFTAIFAAARVAGWCAHIEEQRRTGRLIRPNARYVGHALESP